MTTTNIIAASMIKPIIQDAPMLVNLVAPHIDDLAPISMNVVHTSGVTDNVIHSGDNVIHTN